MLKTFSLTDIGRVRSINQDYLYTNEMPIGKLNNLFIVADGMGGHKAGDYASRFTVETIVKSVSESILTDPKEIVAEAIRKANAVVFDQSVKNPEMNGMGSTVVVCTILDDAEALVANVGDSRLYLIEEDIRQITRDHSLVEEMVRVGEITREAARNHPEKNIITRAIGVKSEVEAEFFQVDLPEEYTILMCSDGLTNMLEDARIKQIIDKGSDVVDRAQQLVEEANENGGKDNIAVVLIEPHVKRS